ncbi:HD-GYP domain-containing protein [Shewanella gelidii]|uniref:Metal-dependent phosphohydrolase n=1 Tax=Shewanella gelidii TaxID=1642821 RepID=A0A917JI71_9GAMM|nr:HD domain-containing phosphohydrolase [Shewanella gelidii]MCL1096562.1 HD domain-containing protein [Shewanella gelidii]GGI68410.1 metal-dependent phosphohydrolase [Shewanella gelidii]
MNIDSVNQISDVSIGHWRKLIFKRLFSFLAILCIPVYLTSVYLFAQDNNWLMVALDTVFYMLLLIVLFAKRLANSTRYLVGCYLGYFVGASMLLAIGPTGAGFFWLFIFPPLAAMLLGYQHSLYAQVINIFTLTLIGFAYHFGLLSWPSLPDFNATIWAVVSINFLVINAMLTLSISYLLNKLSVSLISIQASRQATVIGLARLAEYRDNETGAHLLRMRQYARMLAIQFSTKESAPEELTGEFIQDIALSAILHDIGKVGIADSILLKPGKLSADEYQKMQSHPLIGSSVIHSLRQYAPQCSLLKMGEDIASGHHEKWDGTGYPQGLSNKQIPLAARIVALADVYDALTSPRCYKEPFSHQRAMEIILEGRAKHFDPEIVDCLTEIQDKFEHLSKASLNDDPNSSPAEFFELKPN